MLAGKVNSSCEHSNEPSSSSTKEEISSAAERPLPFQRPSFM